MSQNEIAKIEAMLETLDKRMQTLEEKITPVITAFEKARWTKSMMIGLAVIIGSIVAIGGGLKTIIGWFK